MATITPDLDNLIDFFVQNQLDYSSDIFINNFKDFINIDKPKSTTIVKNSMLHFEVWSYDSILEIITNLESYGCLKVI